MFGLIFGFTKSEHDSIHTLVLSYNYNIIPERVITIRLHHLGRDTRMTLYQNIKISEHLDRTEVLSHKVLEKKTHEQVITSNGISF